MSDIEKKENPSHQKWISELEASGYKVIREFSSFINGSLENEVINRKSLMIIDFEATGKEASKDLPIEIGLIRVEYDPVTFAIGRVLERYSGFEDCGFELDPEVERVTNLQRQMLIGHKFDDEHINNAIKSCDFVVAHNASYDRVMGERRFNFFAEKAWGCSYVEGPWEAMGINSKGQEFLAYKVAGIHYGAHRALNDCEALLEILNSKAHDGRNCFAHVFENAAKPSYTVWAEMAPFDKKDYLRNSGYRWNADEPGRIPKTWYKNGVKDLQAEFAFLKKIYDYPAVICVDTITNMQRHSSRFESRKKMKIDSLDEKQTSIQQEKQTSESVVAIAQPPVLADGSTFGLADPFSSLDTPNKTSSGTNRLRFRR